MIQLNCWKVFIHINYFLDANVSCCLNLTTPDIWSSRKLHIQLCRQNE